MNKYSLKSLVLFGLTMTGVPASLYLAGTYQGSAMSTANAAEQNPTDKVKPAAQYNASGELIRPTDHFEWIFIGAPVTPNDMNDGKAAFPEFHNVYMDPSSYKAYKKTGKFAEGTVILKELVSVGAKSTESGNGYFQGEFVSLEASVKDTVRFKDEPGGWAFFRFGEAPNYKNNAVKMKTSDCNSCHSSAPEDYVFTNTYPVLRSVKAKLISK